MNFLYSSVITMYQGLIHLVSPYNGKAKEWVDGRKDALAFLDRTDPISDDLIWFHCASLGEFEQGKPVMEKFMQDHPNWKLLVTFFSPSGYNVRKDYPIADFVIYLPEENANNVSKFLQVFNPKIAVFVKYEFWFGYLQGLKALDVPTIFISSTFRKNQKFFKWYGEWFLNQLKSIRQFFVQDRISYELLKNNGVNQVEISGDTRFDRVLQDKASADDIVKVHQFSDQHKVLFFGSAWEVELNIAISVIKQLPQGWKVVIAPHEINENKILKLVREVDRSVCRYTTANDEELKTSDVLILDTVGVLARSYRYANLAVVGGGFIDGIHNILEPLVFGSKVLFGPNHGKFWEGAAAIQSGVGIEINSKNGVELVLREMSEYRDDNEDPIRFIESYSGGSEIIRKYLNKLT